MHRQLLLRRGPAAAAPARRAAPPAAAAPRRHVGSRAAPRPPRPPRPPTPPPAAVSACGTPAERLRQRARRAPRPAAKPSRPPSAPLPAVQPVTAGTAPRAAARREGARPRTNPTFEESGERCAQRPTGWLETSAQWNEDGVGTDTAPAQTLLAPLPDDLRTLCSSLETQSPGPELTEKPAVLQAQGCVVAQLLQKLPWLLAHLSSLSKIL